MERRWPLKAQRARARRAPAQAKAIRMGLAGAVGMPAYEAALSLLRGAGPRPS